MYWKPFTLGDECYDLSHLHPRTCRYEQPAKGDKPTRHYTVDVIFSLHCFTRAVLDDEAIDAALLYGDDRETQIVDFQRYELSKRLPAIIESLGSRKCFEHHRSSFLDAPPPKRSTASNPNNHPKHGSLPPSGSQNPAGFWF